MATNYKNETKSDGLVYIFWKTFNEEFKVLTKNT